MRGEGEGDKRAGERGTGGARVEPAHEGGR